MFTGCICVFVQDKLAEREQRLRNLTANIKAKEEKRKEPRELSSPLLPELCLLSALFNSFLPSLYNSSLGAGHRPYSRIHSDSTLHIGTTWTHNNTDNTDSSCRQ